MMQGVHCFGLQAHVVSSCFSTVAGVNPTQNSYPASLRERILHRGAAMRVRHQTDSHTCGCQVQEAVVLDCVQGTPNETAVAA